MGYIIQLLQLYGVIMRLSLRNRRAYSTIVFEIVLPSNVDFRTRGVGGRPSLPHGGGRGVDRHFLTPRQNIAKKFLRVRGARAPMLCAVTWYDTRRHAPTAKCIEYTNNAKIYHFIVGHIMQTPDQDT